MATVRKKNNTVRRMVMLAMFTAMAYVIMLLIHIKVGFLTMDVKDAVITLCGLYFGPASALLIAIVVPLLELATSDTGLYGLIMNMLGSVSFSVTVSLFYKWKKTIWGALMGLLSGVAVMTAVMLMANLFITPYYMGTTMAAVRELIPALLLPFNLLKGMINAGAVLLLYKPMSRALRKAGILRRSESAVQLAKNGENAPRSATKSGSKLIGLLISVDALALVALAVYLIFNVLNGSFSFGI
jgi:riboflavin transporter FmnP